MGFIGDVVAVFPLGSPHLMPVPPLPDDVIATAICDAAAGLFDNPNMPLLNVLEDARERRKAARLAISARDVVRVTVATASIAAAALWLGVDEDLLMARIQCLSSGEWAYVLRALLATV